MLVDRNKMWFDTVQVDHSTHTRTPLDCMQVYKSYSFRIKSQRQAYDPLRRFRPPETGSASGALRAASQA
jgi:hypothetical protein